MKKIISLTVLSGFLLILFFVSCGKELSFESTGTRGGTAKYSFGDESGSCTEASISGTFKAGVAATAANIVTISVKVETPGSFVVSTNSINGLSFSGSGVFYDTGVQKIVLTATGTPATAGVYGFMPPGACAFLVTVM